VADIVSASAELVDPKFPGAGHFATADRTLFLEIQGYSRGTARAIAGLRDLETGHFS
jgi:hypothetical protein